MRRAATTLVMVAVGLFTLPASEPGGALAATCEGETATIVGTEEPDRIEGTPARDVIAANGGNDIVLGNGGEDLVCLGYGTDSFTGYTPDVAQPTLGATVYGGPGGDSLSAGQGQSPSDDHLFGESGNDRLFGYAGSDELRGGKGNDEILARNLDGPTDHDVIDGGAGEDHCRSNPEDTKEGCETG